MNTDRKILRLCTAVILCALGIRLLSGLQPDSRADVASALLFLQTGRIVRQVDTSQLPESALEETRPTQPEAAEQVVFTGDEGIELNDYAGKKPDVEALLEKPLYWDLTAADPAVLIYHTHATESYENTEGYTESSEYRTLDADYNMLSVGQHLIDCLQKQGIAAIQDRSLHDYPSYNGSYTNSYRSAKQYLQDDPSVQLVLDLHRDAATDDQGQQVGYTVNTDRGKAAMVMIVVGGGNENWKENMALAVKLQVQLEKLCPGICRPICLRSSGFNQVISPGALLVEMGAAGNTRQEALLAAEYLAQAIGSLKAGSTS